MELRERNRRTQQFVATLQPGPPDNVTDVGSDPQLFIPDTETSTLASSDVMGPPSDLNGDNNRRRGAPFLLCPVPYLL
jgi:hypothetical protein